MGVKTKEGQWYNSDAQTPDHLNGPVVKESEGGLQNMHIAGPNLLCPAH